MKHTAFLLLLVAGCLHAGPVVARPAGPPPLPQDARGGSELPQQLNEVVRVVDGDTIHVLRDGKTAKLRLLSVDTEEKFSGGGSSSASKPQTVFGEECALWAREFFAALADEDGKTRVGLRFPDDRESFDIYGRLLCHVVLADGRDFNLLLVREGKSPYFDKYGRSRICHEEFVAAQEEARAARLGVWDPRTNVPLDPEGPAAKRPYEQLLPWWSARAEAIESYRRRHAAEPGRVLAADEPEGMARALREGSGAVELFGEPARLFEEDDGSLTVLFRSSDSRNSLRVSIPKEARAAHEAVDIDALFAEYRQNFVYVRGTLGRNARGFLIVSEDPAQWRRAGPEPGETSTGDATGETSESLFYGLEMGGQVVGYFESTLRPPEDGERMTRIETHTFVKMSLLGQDFDTRVIERYLVDPGTRRVSSYEIETLMGEMELGQTIVVESDRAIITPDGGEERTVELGPEVVALDSMRYDHVLRELAAGEGAVHTWRALEFQTGTIQDVTFTRKADETLEYLGRDLPCALFDVKQPGLGVDGTVWVERDTARLFRAELSTGVVLSRAPPGIVGKIKRAELDDILLARVDTAIADYQAISSMKVRARIRSLGEELTPESLNVPGQRFEGTVEGALVDGVFEIEIPRYDGAGAPAFPLELDADDELAESLGPELLIEADDAVLVAFAQGLTAGAPNCWEAALRLSRWVSEEIQYEIPGGSARATFDARKGECGSQSRLLVALCRGVGIPARVATGGMYTPNYGGSFGQHAWAEIHMGAAGWIPVDSTAAEPDYIDSGHIRLGLQAGFQPEEMEVLEYRLGNAAPAEKATMAPFDPLPWELGETYTYRYLSKGESIGTDSFTIASREETETGVVFSCESTVELSGRKLTCTYRFDAAGRPLDYRLEGKAGSVDYTIDCEVEGSQLIEKAVQSGTPVERSVELPDEVYLIDNNNFSGYALLMSAVPLTEGNVVAFRVFHPTSMQLLPVEITVGAQEAIEIGGESFDCTRCELIIAGTPLDLWVDARGRVLRESGGSGRLVLELQNP